VASASRFYAINPDGTDKWSQPIDSNFIVEKVVLAQDGTVYVVTNPGSLLAFTPEGGLKWSFDSGAGGTRPASPVVDSTGVVYFRRGTRLFAVNPDGMLKWSAVTVPIPDTGGAVSIGGDGSIYVPPDNFTGLTLSCLRPGDGSLKWGFPVPRGTDVNNPSIDIDGTIYIGMQEIFFAINPDGSEKWHTNLGNFSGGDRYTNAVVGSDGLIYFGMGRYLVALNKDGSVRYQFCSPGSLGEPMLGPDGTLYVGCGDGFLYAIQTPSAGLAASAWPVAGHDAQHTGRAGP
jgi:outer membrane protein assembly factor BamB